MLPGTIIMLIFIVVVMFGGAITLVAFNIKSAERHNLLTTEPSQEEE